jgi:hypothetical protein
VIGFSALSQQDRKVFAGIMKRNVRGEEANVLSVIRLQQLPNPTS